MDSEDYIINTDKSYLNISNFSNLELANRCYNDIITKLEIRPEISVFGRKCHQNRNVGFFSDTSVGYYYSKQLSKSIPLTLNLKLLINIINDRYKSNFNGILVNQYIDGNDYIGTHSDDESGIDSAGVVCLSMGACRKFRIRNKKTKKIVEDVVMKDGMLIHMGGDFQKEFTHEIPIEKKVKSSRVSFTFRNHKN